MTSLIVFDLFIYNTSEYTMTCKINKKK
jgi:hypothetical protein